MCRFALVFRPLRKQVFRLLFLVRNKGFSALRVRILVVILHGEAVFASFEKSVKRNDKIEC